MAGWTGLQALELKKFTCGYCGQTVASKEG